MQGLRGRSLLALCAAATAALAIGAPVATAQTSFPCSKEGDPCGEVVGAFATSGGVSVAVAPTDVNGKSVPTIWYTNLDDPNLYRVTTSGVDLPPIPVKGAQPIQALTYDATTGHFWGVDFGVPDVLGTLYNVYEIDMSGNAVLRFIAVLPDCDNGDPSVPGDSPGPCEGKLDGLAYDGSSDSLWFSPDSSERIYHYTTTGIFLGYYDSNQPGQAMTEPTPTPDGTFAGCSDNYNSGIAVGAPQTDSAGSPTGRSTMYLMNPDCATFDAGGAPVTPFTWFSYLSDDNNNPLKQEAYPTYDGNRPEDNECDSLTFPTNVIWVRDEVDNIFRAFKANPCITGGGLALSPTKARMSGGGNLPSGTFTTVMGNSTFIPDGGTVQVGLLIHCGAASGIKPNHLSVTWNGNSFHATTFTASQCSDTAAPNEKGSDFDTIGGTATGRCKLKNSSTWVTATATFSFTDGGEGADPTSPSQDKGSITVTGANGCAVSGNGQPVPNSLGAVLDGDGNYQAHGMTTG